MINRNQRKREFLQMILNRYDHADLSVTYLLEYLATQADLIDTVTFTDHVEYTKRGLAISYDRTIARPFTYYKNQRSYYLPEQAFHDLRMNSFHGEQFYLEFDLPNYYQLACQYDIFENNSYYADQRIKEDASKWERLEKDLHLKLLTDHFNALLDQRDYEQANRLLHQIEQLRGDDHA